MLSACRPFSHAVEFASRGGESVLVQGIVTAVTGEETKFIVSNDDTQAITDTTGSETIIHGRNISEIVDAYYVMFPWLIPERLELTIRSGDDVRQDVCPLIPMNRELIATKAKRLLRSIANDRRTQG